jgi:signal peptidase
MKKKDVLLGLLVFFIIMSGTHLLSPFITGSSLPLIVLSGSMHPYMRVGDMVVTESVNPNDLVVGDVLTFRMPGEDDDVFVTHRIVSIEGSDTLVFQTKGDANEEKDDFLIYSEDVIGKVTFVIPFAGYLPESSKSSSLFFVSIIIPSALLIIGEIKNIIKYSNPVKARKDEKEKKKQSRRITYTPEIFRLMSIVLISFIVIFLLTLPYINLNHETELTDGYTIENPGILSSIYVITPDELTDRLQIEPWYSIVPAGNASTIKVAEENMHVKVSSVPYVLPVQWIIMLAEKGVFMPAVGVVLFYMGGVMLVTIPLWYRKSVRGEKKRSLRYRLVRFKRDIRRMKIME